MAAWLAAVAACAFVMSTLLGDALTTDAALTNRPEAKQAQELLEESACGDPSVPGPGQARRHRGHGGDS